MGRRATFLATAVAVVAWAGAGSAWAAPPPAVGPEAPLSDPVPQSDFEIDTASAWNGDHWLVVWTESVDDWPAEVHAARVGPDGQVLDAESRLIRPTERGRSGSGLRMYTPSVASDGDDFLVVWQEIDPELTCEFGDCQESTIRGARVRGDGTVLDPGGIDISTSSTGERSGPDVASNGDAYLVTWSHSGPNEDPVVQSARVSPGGAVLDPGGVRVAGPVTAFPARPAVTSNGTSYLVGWNRDDDAGGGARFSRVTAAGHSLDPAGIPVLSGAAITDVVARRGDWFVVGRRDATVVGAAVGAGGVVPDPDGSPIATGVRLDSAPMAAQLGSVTTVAWRDGTSIRGARWSATAGALEPAGVPLVAGEVSSWPFGDAPGLAAGAGRILLDWTGLDGPRSRPTATRVEGVTALDVPGVDLPEEMLANRTTLFALAWNGTHHLAVWIDEGAEGGTARVGRFDGDGGLDGQGTILPTGFLDGPGFAAASDGSSYLVVWREYGPSTSGPRIVGRRVGPDGRLLGTGAFVISAAAGDQQDPAVTWTGSHYLVAWSDGRSGAGPFGAAVDIYAARVSAAGTVLDPSGIPVTTAPASQQGPAVASGPSSGDSLVTWYSGTSGLDTWDVLGARVTGAGVVRDAVPLTVSVAPGGQVTPDLDWDGSNWFVVWGDSRAPSTALFGARVSPAGTVLDPAGRRLADAPGFPDPAVSWSGAVHVVAYTRSDVSTEPHVVALRVGADGSAVDANPFTVGDPTAFLPVLASGPGGAVRVGYSRLEPDLGFVPRGYLRTIDPK